VTALISRTQHVGDAENAGQDTNVRIRRVALNERVAGETEKSKDTNR